MPPFSPHDIPRTELDSWLEANDLLVELGAPASKILPFLEETDSLQTRLRRHSTVGSLLDEGTTEEERGDLAGLGVDDDLRRAALSYLHCRANANRHAAQRAALWSRAPATKALEGLRARLHDLRNGLLAVADEDAAATESEINICADSAQILGRFRVGEEWIGRATEPTTLALAGFESHPIRSRCGCWAARYDAACVHQLWLVEWALDTLHDAEAPDFETLKRVADFPTWKRLLTAITAPDVSAAHLEESSRRVVWRLGAVRDGRLDLEPALQKRLRNGRWSKGARVDVQDIFLEDVRLSEPDQRLARAMCLYEQRVEQSEPDSIAGLYLAEVLDALVEHPRVFSKRETGGPIQVVRRACRLALLEDTAGVRLALNTQHRSMSPAEALASTTGPRHLLHVDTEGGQAEICELGARVRRLLEVAATYPAFVPVASAPRLLDAVSEYQSEIELEVPKDLRGLAIPASAVPVLQLSPIGDSGLKAAMRMRPLREGVTRLPGIGSEFVFGAADGGRVYVERNLSEERARAETLIDALGLEASHRERFEWSLARPDEALGLLKTCRDLGDHMLVEWPDTDAWRVGHASAKRLKIQARSVAEWFQVSGGVEVDGQLVALSDLLAAARSRRRFIKLGAGRFAEIESALLERLAEMRTVVEDDEEQLMVPRVAVDNLAGLVNGPEALEFDEMGAKFVASLEAARQLNPTPPKTLNATLRGYQVEGHAWLARLAAWGGGACLADEMGLGKTLQTLAILLDRAEIGPALIVAPTSVGHGWIEEAKRFAPSLDVRLYHGPTRRGLLNNLGPGTALVTSYDILVRDSEALAEIEFASCVLDEAQAIKNADTRRARAARKIRAKWRLALSGTPVENHLGDLWSLFDLLNPGLLGPWHRFRAEFALPIERLGMTAKRTELASILRPFLLRRTKAQVAPELPERTEIIHAVELAPDERALYESVRKETIDALVRDDAPGDRFRILAAITKLRRLACHPQLEFADSFAESSKLAAFMELVRTLEQSGQRALVFSQFTGHLAFIRKALDERGTNYLYLDGSTPMRQRATLVKTWQSETPGLFLISLKAGGTGLNLTGADCVIHLDPWWNPAAEDQATDRTHRIGQTRPVTVVRLIAQDTIEETVVELHAQKRELARSLLDGAEQVGSLSSTELLDLIRNRPSVEA